MGEKYSHFNYTKRMQLESWLKVNIKPKEIAERLGFHVNSIYNEIKRGTYEHRKSDYTSETRYSAEKAEKNYQEHLREKGPDLKIGSDHEYASYLEKKVYKDKYSPGATLGEIKQKGIQFNTMISKTTFYRYIDKGVFLMLTNDALPVKRNKKKREHKKVRAARAPKGMSIEQRPSEIDERKDFGHWEMDSVVGKQGTTAALLVLTERKTRDEIARKIPNKEMKTIVEELDKIESWLGPERFALIFKSITVDNGSEFQDCKGMERCVKGEGKRTTIYYCHPYSSCERGSNENQNRLIRRFYPKGYDFTNVTQRQVDKVVKWINTYPREQFGWRSSEDLYQEEIKEILNEKDSTI